jgi:uncharacterized radical SAM superfamily Fe-S cluster-containing enzyme
MHFQDVYNMDLERLRSCGVHYVTPDGRIISFCTYNKYLLPPGEDRFSVQMDDVKEVKELKPAAKF